ncbi:MAG: hypothetical protein IT423_20075 [Pirellulaceae bacterium]|nr:hypothetical protein [Pirellulaceae bacterium]
MPRLVLLLGSLACACSWATVSLVTAQEAAGKAATTTTKLSAPALFPEKTLAYLRVDNVKELKEALGRSTMGKLSQDDEVRPILSEFYGSLINSTDAIREFTGLNLDEMLAIPTGELAVALLPSDQTSVRSERRNENQNPSQTEARAAVSQPSVALMMDAGDEISGVQVILDRMQERITDRMVHTESQLGSLTLHQYANPDRAQEQFGYFIDLGVFVACSNLTALERLAKRWTGQSVDWPTLSENRRFTSIMGRCVGVQGERPHASFFVDPLALIRQVTPKSTGATMAFAMLPALGLDDIQAVGGSWIVAPPDFDSITHFHVLLGSPRRAILALLRPKTGSITPENWVPASVASYSTINWDAASTLQGIQQLYDQFRGEDAMKNEILDRVSGRLGLDFKKDILENIEGRFTMLQGFIKPAVSINGGSNVYAIRLRNPEKFANTVLPALLKQIESREEVTTENFGRLQAQVFKPGPSRENSAVRQPEICITMIDDYVVIADSKFMMSEVSSTLGANADRLSEALDFQLISDRITAQLQGTECSALSYARPEESLQMFYELAKDPANRDRLRQVSANNGFFKALLAALDNHKLPEFSVIAKYLAPGGGFLVEEETGLHYMSFGLRRE